MNRSSLSTAHSFGVGGCAACTSSPKKACVDLRGAGQCGTPAGSTCDCDVNEWNQLINYDFSEGLQADWGDGLKQLVGEDPAAARRRGGQVAKKDLTIVPDSRPVPSEPAAHRRGRVAKRVQELEKDGGRRGTDFTVSADGLHVYTLCK